MGSLVPVGLCVNCVHTQYAHSKSQLDVLLTVCAKETFVDVVSSLLIDDALRVQTLVLRYLRADERQLNSGGTLLVPPQNLFRYIDIPVGIWVMECICIKARHLNVCPNPCHTVQSCSDRRLVEHGKYWIVFHATCGSRRGLISCQYTAKDCDVGGYVGIQLPVNIAQRCLEYIAKQGERCLKIGLDILERGIRMQCCQLTKATQYAVNLIDAGEITAIDTRCHGCADAYTAASYVEPVAQIQTVYGVLQLLWVLRCDDLHQYALWNPPFHTENAA